MRIGIDIRALMEGKTTGVEVYLTNLLNNLFALDTKNEYILFANSFGKIVLPKFDYLNVKIIVTKYPNKFFNLAQKFLHYPKVDKLLGGVDLFFSPHWRVTALSQSTPLVVTFHDLFFEIMPEFFTVRRRIWHKFMNYRNAAATAKKIIAVSESTTSDLIRLYEIDKDRIQMIYSGVSFPKHETDNKPQATSHFLYFGTFEPRKNIDVVIAAYANYWSASAVKRPLVLAGSVGWKLRPRIPEHLRAQIIIKKNPTENEKADLFANAFAFVFPSFYEGFGFPVLEAAASALPVITSFNSSLAEVGRDFALFVNPLRPSQISEAMLSLETDPELYQNLRNRGLAAAGKFTWEKTAMETLKLFNSAV